MMSSVIFITGLMLSFGTKIFVLAERIGELIVRLFYSSAKTTFRACKDGSGKFAPNLKEQCLLLEQE